MEDFEKLYNLYSKGLYKYLYYLSGDKFFAEELTQETFYQAIKSIHRFNGDSKVSTWLYQIGKNVYYKQSSKLRTQNIDVFVESEACLIDQDTPDSVYETKEERGIIIKALYELNEQNREIIMMRLFEELSFREIGASYHQSEGWARTNFYRAKLLMRELINKEKGE